MEKQEIIWKLTDQNRKEFGRSHKEIRRTAKDKLLKDKEINQTEFYI